MNFKTVGPKQNEIFLQMEGFTLPDDTASDLEPILDVITRWSSTYSMLERAYILKDAIAVYVDISIAHMLYSGDTTCHDS